MMARIDQGVMVESNDALAKNGENNDHRVQIDNDLVQNFLDNFKAMTP